MTSTVFLRNGTSYKPVNETALDMHPILPPGNFIIAKDMLTDELFFDQVDSFSLPSKTYGNTDRHATRILDTFQSRSASTGVLLSGEKGSGKTLLAKTLTNRGAELGFPTIIVNAPWTGDKFNKLIQDIAQPCIVFFDEFEKTYDRDKQEALLTLLDGVFPSKKLFVLTCNDSYRVDNHMRNRPGRIFYMIDFKGLTPDFVTEYCKDNLGNQEHIDQVVQVAQLFNQFNFDMLKALVEEMNRYGESPRDALEMLNAKPQGESAGTYTVELTVKDRPTIRLDDTYWNTNPMANREIELYFSTTNDEGGTESDCATFVPSDLKSINDGRLVYTNHSGDVATFTRVIEKMYDYRMALA